MLPVTGEEEEAAAAMLVADEGMAPPDPLAPPAQPEAQYGASVADYDPDPEVHAGHAMEQQKHAVEHLQQPAPSPLSLPVPGEEDAAAADGQLHEEHQQELHLQHEEQNGTHGVVIGVERHVMDPQRQQEQQEMVVQTEQASVPEPLPPPPVLQEEGATAKPRASSPAAAGVKQESSSSGGSKGAAGGRTKGGSLDTPFMRALAAQTPVLAGLYSYPKSQEGVHHEPWIRLFGAVLEPAPDGFVVTDHRDTGGVSLWTFVLRLLGVRSLGWRALDESATWKSVGIRVTKLRKQRDEGQQQQQQQQQQQPEQGSAGGAKGKGKASKAKAPPKAVVITNWIGDHLQWRREFRTRPFDMRVPRFQGHTSGRSGVVDTSTVEPPPPPSTRLKATYALGIALRHPDDPGLHKALANAVDRIAPGAVPARMGLVFEEYRRLYDAYEPLSVQRSRASSSSASAAAAAMTARAMAAAALLPLPLPPLPGRGVEELQQQEQQQEEGGDGEAPPPQQHELAPQEGEHTPMDVEGAQDHHHGVQHVTAGPVEEQTPQRHPHHHQHQQQQQVPQLPPPGEPMVMVAAEDEAVQQGQQQQHEHPSSAPLLPLPIPAAHLPHVHQPLEHQQPHYMEEVHHAYQHQHQHQHHGGFCAAPEPDIQVLQPPPQHQEGGFLLHAYVPEQQ